MVLSRLDPQQQYWEALTATGKKFWSQLQQKRFSRTAVWRYAYHSFNLPKIRSKPWEIDQNNTNIRMVWDPKLPAFSGEHRCIGTPPSTKQPQLEGGLLPFYFDRRTNLTARCYETHVVYDKPWWWPSKTSVGSGRCLWRIGPRCCKTTTNTNKDRAHGEKQPTPSGFKTSIKHIQRIVHNGLSMSATTVVGS